MRCRYCREEIQDKATKCRECGELLGFRRRLRSLSGLFRAFVGVLVPVASLGLAYVEHQARNQADLDKRFAQIEMEGTEEVLGNVPPDVLVEATRRTAAEQSRRLGAAVFRDDQSRQKAVELRKLNAAESEARERGDTNAADRLRVQVEELETAIIEAEDIRKEEVPKSLGFLSLQGGQPQKAVKRFEEALQKDPLDVEARKGLIYSRTLARAKER